MLIQVDVDDTLYDAGSLFNKLSPEFGIDWPEGYRWWMTAEEFGTNLEQLKKLFRKCHSREYVSQNIPFENAADTLRQIVEDYDAVEIAYVSDRNEQQTAALRDWLDEYGFLNSGDEFVAATKDKREWMRENKPDIVIDDRVRTMLLARYELGSQVIALNMPHNISLRHEADGIYVVDSWKEINEVLREKVLPVVQTQVKTKEYQLV